MVLQLTNCRYLTTHYHVAALTHRTSLGDRKSNLHASQSAYESFLRRLDDYDTLSADQCRMLERFLEGRDTFTIVSTTDAATRRETKIQRFQEQKRLEAGLRALESRARANDAVDDDDVLRKLRLVQISKYAHDSFETLESIAQELHILSLAPSEPPRRDPLQHDDREKRRPGDGYTERLDSPHLSAGLSGPLLDSKGKPMRPFTLLGKRDELRNGVFRPDHSLPTMSIDEYLEEEKRRGGMIEGGGPQSGIRPEVDEDDFERADQETMKARAWDEFTEANPKGSGNTINRG